MKKLFFLLLLGNVVFYLWVTNVQPKQGQDSRLQVDLSLEPIVLVGELEIKSVEKPVEKAEKVKAIAIAKEPPKQVVGAVEEITPAINNISKQEKKFARPFGKQLVCYQTSSVREKKVAIALQNSLKESAIQSEIIANKVTENAGYWVMYPVAQNMKEARANVKLLKGKGVKDFWLFRKGLRKGAISLGMFKEKQRAENVRAEWLAKGVELEIKPHKVNREQFLLKFRTDKLLKELGEITKMQPEAEIKINLSNKGCN
jgi:hypothetical protein